MKREQLKIQKNSTSVVFVLLSTSDSTSVFYCQSSQCMFLTDDGFHYDGTTPALSFTVMEPDSSWSY